MLTIRCTACGRTYDYRGSELCPRCGAYNRPPHRVRIDSDGTIRAAAETPRPKPDTRVQRGRVKDGKLCYEQKECHENKTCYEETARRVRDGRGDGYQPEPRRSAAADQARPSDAAGKSGGKSLWQGLEDLAAQLGDEKPLSEGANFAQKAAFGGRRRNKPTGAGTALAIAVAVMVAVVPNLMESCESHHVSVPEPDYSYEALIPEEDWGESAKAIPTDSILADAGVTQYCAMGESFVWNGGVACVDAFEWMDGDSGVVYMDDVLAYGRSAYLLVLDEWYNSAEYMTHECLCENGNTDSSTLEFSGIGETPLCIWVIFTSTSGSGEVTAVQLW